MEPGDLESTRHALEESERRLRAMFETAVEGIVTIDAVGTVETMNAAAERLFGYDRAETIGRNVTMLMPSPYREEHDQYLLNYLETGVAKIIGIGREVSGRKKDGSVFPMKLAVSEVRLGERRIFTGFIEDLTERKRLEREAEEWREELERRVEARTAELARANAELESFAHIISHDLRTPLRGIRNYVDFLSEDLSDKVQGESADDLRRLGRASEELERMIQDLLDYTRIGRSRAPHETFDLGEVVRETAGLVREIRPDCHIEIAGDLPRLAGPKGMIRHIFQNLIENGVHYNRSDAPTVTIDASRRPERRWEIRVRDNGIGIDPAHHEKIFQMFHRLHADADYTGTGIGLAAVRKAVERLGGTIRVESEIGRGSDFVVELPEAATTG